MRKRRLLGGRLSIPATTRCHPSTVVISGQKPIVSNAAVCAKTATSYFSWRVGPAGLGQDFLRTLDSEVLDHVFYLLRDY